MIFMKQFEEYIFYFPDYSEQFVQRKLGINLIISCVLSICNK